MSKLKKLSFILILVVALFAGFFGFNIKSNNITNLEAETEKISLVVKKVKYNNDKIKDENEIAKKLGKFSPRELYTNVDDILASTTGENDFVTSGDVVSIIPTENEAVLVYLAPSDNTSIIRMLSANLNLTTKDGKSITYQIESINKTEGGAENKIAISAFDFSSVTSSLGTEFAYSDIGHFNFTFEYSYTTNGTNTISESKSFEFYLIDNESYFSQANKFKIENSLDKSVGEEIYYYNASKKEKPTLIFDPHKFTPTINYTYNETSATLTTQYDSSTKSFKLVSSNENIYNNKALELNDNNLKIELDRIGKYEISYQLVIQQNNNLIVIDKSKTQKLSELQPQTLYMFGYETLYKNYQEKNEEIKRLNQNYKRLYDKNFESDFSYMNEFFTVNSETGLNEANINNVLTYLNENSDYVQKIAKTNQAPIKINSYVTENVSGAKYYIINQNKTTNKYEIKNVFNFSPSVRFEKEGMYVVIIPYKFETYKTDIFYKVFMFKIENSTPSLNFYTDESLSTPLNANGFTKKDVYCAWDKEENNPFSYPNQIKFIKDKKVLIEGTDYKILSHATKNYVKFEANEENNGSYIVQLTYGTNEVTVEKNFTIDTSEIEFKVVEVEKNNNSYKIKNNLELTNSKTTTENNFAVFVKNKDVENNILSVSYDYISLNYVTAQKQYEIDENGKLLIYNNFQLSTIRENLTYSNSTINNLKDLTNLTIGKDNTNAVISINALYKFTIKDLAGNEKIFFVLLDNTQSVVLESNSVVCVREKDLFVESTTTKATINEKDDSLNLVSNNYSLIFGNYKAIEFKVDQNNIDFAKNYFGIDLSIPEDLTFVMQNVLKEVSKPECERKLLSEHNSDEITIIEKIDDNNIFSIDLSKNTENKEFDCIYTIKSNSSSKQFELNTDKHQVLIFGKKDGVYTRIYRTNPTNLDNVYITFVNKTNNDGYDLESLQLDFYPITETNNNITFPNNPTETYNLLNVKDSGQIVCDGKSYGEFVINPLVTTYKDGKYVAKEGKYVITKKLENGTTSKQTFYVDRKSPISYFENNKNVLIGKNINITLDGKTLSAETIYNYLLNNTTLQTNMLNFVWTNSLDDSGNTLDFVYKYENLSKQDRINLKINFALINSNNELITDLTTKLTAGEYTLIIYDNTYFISKPEDFTVDNIRKANYVELKISAGTKAPSGQFVKDDNESLQNVKSTNTNKLSFEFEDSESEFIYNINLNNIVLKQNGTTIFKTTTENDSSRTGWFNLGDNKIVYYISYVGNVFNLSRKQIGTTSRYKYTLTILDPTKNCETLFENGTSREAVYNLELSYDYKPTYSLKDNEGKDFGTNNYEMIIDHTAPEHNFNEYLKNDKFLSSEEKSELKNSFSNKDISSQINFDNYVLFVTSAPTKAESTDTSLIYIRKYNKYSDENIENQQSLVIEDPRYSDQTISRYRFDVNTYITNADGTSKKLYNVKQYGDMASNFFSDGEGFYEIIEMDEAGNYSIYTVYYSANDLSLTASYTLSDPEEEYTTNSSGTELFDPNFELTKINTTDFDYLDVKILINEKAENALDFNLKFLPFEVSSQNIEYVNSASNLVNRINEIIKNYNTINEYGNVCKIIISNRNGTTLTITNSTPNKEFEIKDYIKNYDNNRIVLTVPNSVENATFIKTLKVYPVVDGSKESASLEKDSNQKTIEKELLNSQNYVYTFTDTAYINGATQQGIKVYYFVWTDNFGRTQKTVRYLGEKSEAKFIFENDAQFVTKNGENYTQNSENIYFEFNPDLYSIEIEYQLLPSTTNNKINLTDKDKTNSKIDLFNLLKNTDNYNDNFLNSQIKFVVTLTDLTKLDEELQSKATYSYIYYPIMPKIEFTDSASNSLSIIANSENIISTSKNVHFSYINNTLFNLSSIDVTRTYLDENNQTQIETFKISSFEHTFSSLGNYKIVVINELGKQETYMFNITTATNKTYTVETNEDSMTNFELQSYGISEKITFGGTEQTFETYYSIYKAKVIVNTDFNLSLEEIAYENNDGYSLYKIKKGGEDFKYIAIRKVEYNSNFLNLKNEKNSLQIVNVNDSQNTNLTGNIQGYTLTTTEGIKLTVPLYNTNNVNTETTNNNKIILKLYYNNQLIDLNANIYSTVEDEYGQHQVLLLDDVPSGVYSLYFEDIAGNIQLFNGNSFLNLSICKEVAIKINDEIPVDYQIYNSNVKLSILNEKQYISTQDKSLKVQAFLNNNEMLNVTKDENKNYIFTEYGFYKVIISGHISSTGPEITKTIYFTILNKNEAIKEFSFVSLNGQNISKVLRDGKDITTEIKQILALFPIYKNEDGTYNQSQLEQLKLLKNTDFEKTYLYNLNLKSEIEYSFLNENDEVSIEKYLAGGEYEIFVKTQNLILGEQNYSFNVWMRDKDAKININSTLEKNGETSKAITLSYNPYLIFTQIGECAIYVNNTIVAQIDRSSSNAVSTYTIPRDAKGTFIVQVKSSSGNTELSFVLNKKEPLSTVSIIVIVVACLVVAGGIFLFIKLRTKMKVR